MRSNIAVDVLDLAALAGASTWFLSERRGFHQLPPDVLLLFSMWARGSVHYGAHTNSDRRRLGATSEKAHKYRGSIAHQARLLKQQIIAICFN